MKPLLFFLILLLVSGCAVHKNDVINDYLELELKQLEKRKKSTDIIIIEEKISNNMTLDIFKGQRFYDPKTGKYGRFDGVKEDLYTDKLWKVMNSEYMDINFNYYYVNKDYWLRGDYWQKSDFKHKDVTLLKYDSLPKPDMYIPMKSEDNKEIYTFSDPIYYDNKKYIVFTVLKGDLLFRQIMNPQTIIMKKEKGKWVPFSIAGFYIYN